MSKFYITTPIYYVNGQPSIGHAYTNIAADILARYQRMLGHEVFFMTGTDENSQKNVEAAAKAGRGDDIQGYLDEMSAVWQQSFDTLNLTHDRFIRTTQDDHTKAVAKFWQAVEAKGDIYKGEYEGLYCTGCEAFITESELVDGKCQIHKKTVEKIKEENYFFKLSNYRQQLLDHIEKNPDFIMPKSRRNEVVSYIDKFMTDISITRQSMKWGIPSPSDETQRIYVWFDALINYLTGVGYGTDEKRFQEMWPADLHLVGKDIIKFHCALWPAMLMSAGLDLPKHVLAHGFFTIDGEKMSKSLGNVIDPLPIVQDYGNDALRFFLMREIHLGEDGDFSLKRLAERYDGELANELGNLVHRVLSMTEKYFEGIVPERAEQTAKAEMIKDYQKGMGDFQLHSALESVWKIVREANQFIEAKKPWVLAKNEDLKELSDTMYISLETLRILAWLINPFMPETSEKIITKLGLEVAKEFGQDYFTGLTWGKLDPGGKIDKGEALFPRREE